MNKQVSQIIGMVLLSIIIVTYFRYFNTKPPISNQSKITEVSKEKLSVAEVKKLFRLSSPKVPTYKKSITIENDDVQVLLNPKGGMVEKVILKKYKGNDQTPLTLLTAKNSHMSWLLATQNSMVNTNRFDFEVTQYNNEVHFTYILDSAKQQQVKYVYTLPEKGYILNCKVDISGFNPSTDKAQLVWYYAPENLEKDFNLNIRNTYAQCQLQNKSLKYLMKDKEEKVKNVEWSCVKQRFFTVGIVPPKKTVFTHGEIITQSIPSKNQHTLMEVAMRLELPLKSLNKNSHNFVFYFGPNIHKTLVKVAPGFENNHYLGFTPIKQVNKYIISPLASFFDQNTNHYIWVLLLLALFFKLLQLYFAHKDYIITLKQKALQPAVVELKNKYTDKQQAKLAEMNFYTKMGLPPSSFLVKILIALIEIPIFMAMIYFIPNNIGLRQIPFLWTKDLSSADHFINLPFHIPLLGSHISLFALLMCLLSLLRSKQSSQEPSSEKNAHLFKYILPTVMFLAFNSYAVAFCLYRIFSDVLSLIFPLFFRYFVNKDYHLSQIEEKKSNPSATVSQDLPRALARLEKKRKR